MSESELSNRRILDSISDEFEENWTAKDKVDIADYLNRVDEQHRELLQRMLLEIDVELRSKTNQTFDEHLYAEFGRSAMDLVKDLLVRGYATLDRFEEPSQAFDSTRSLPYESSKQIGPYKLLQKIGEGGMGSVWMAEQEEPVRRRVALKLIKGAMADKQVIARFEAERQALAMMDHPNIAKVLDAGTTEDGNPFFVMELIQGIPINEYCDRNKLTPSERLKLFEPLCKAIQHAHQKGIIHRDLKPSNVLVQMHDGEAMSKVIDFGLAKALQHQTKLTDKTMFTEFGQVVGTLQYMSPEQATMDAMDVDTRTDIYSLGVILYELLTGSTPIEKETLNRNGVFKVLEVIREKEPPKPSHRLSSSGDKLSTISELRQIQPGKLQNILRGELDWIVMKALEKDRVRRYETASDFAQDIRRHLEGDTVLARPPSAIYRFRKFIKNHSTLVISLSVIAILLVAGIAGTSWFAFRASRYAELEKSQREKADAKTLEAQRSEKKARNLAAQNAEAEEKVRAELKNTKLAQEQTEFALYSNRLSNFVLHYQSKNYFDAARSLDKCNEKYRGYEYELCRSIFDPSDQTINGSENPFYDITVTKDGETLCAVGKGEIKVWTKGVARDFLLDSKQRFTSCVIDESRGLLYVGSVAGEIVAWNLDNGKQSWAIRPEPRRDLGGFGPAIQSDPNSFGIDRQNWMTIRYVSEKDIIVSANKREVNFWSAQDRNKVGSIKHSSEIMDICLSNDNSLIYVADWVVSSYSFPAGEFVGKSANSRATIRGMVCMADGKVVTGDDAGEINVYSGELKRLKVLDDHPGGVTSVAATKDSSCIFSSGRNGEMITWDSETLSKTNERSGHYAEISSVTVEDSGRFVYSVDFDGTIKKWDLPKAKSARTFSTRETGRQYGFSCDFNGEFVCRKAADDDYIERFEIGTPENSKKVRVVPFKDSVIHSELSPNGSYLFKAYESGKCEVVEIDQEGSTFKFQPKAQIRSSAFLGNGSHIATISRYGEISIRKIAERSLWKTLKERAVSYALATSKDGQTLYFVTKKNLICSLNIAEEKVIKLFESNDRVQALTVDDSGKLLGIGCSKSTKVFELESKKQVAEINEHEGYITSMDFSPDGKTLATAGSDSRIIIWDLEENVRLDSLAETNAAIFVRFSEDGNAIFVGWDSAGEFKKISWPDKKLVWELDGKNTIRCGVSADGKRVLYDSMYDGVTLYDLENENEQPTSKIYQEKRDWLNVYVTATAILNDGRHAVAIVSNNKVVEVDFQNEKITKELDLGVDPTYIALTNDQQKLVCQDGRILYIVDLIEFKIVHMLNNSHDHRIGGLSQDGKLAVGIQSQGESGCSITVTDLQTGMAKIIELPKPATACCFGQNNDRLFVMHPDEMIEYDLSDKKVIRAAESGARRILSMAYNKNAKRIFLGDSGGQVQIWDGERFRPIVSIYTDLNKVAKLFVREKCLVMSDGYNTGQVFQTRNDSRTPGLEQPLQ